jgi:hypothetical protein
VYFRTTRIFVIAAVVAVSGTMTSARAQQATFHLPFKAHWGRATLDPGDYKLSTPLGVSGGHMIQLVRPDKHGIIIVPAVTSTEPTTDRSYLECVKIQGNYVVRRYVTGFSGQVFNFGVAKPETERRTTASVSALVVPVQRATK